MQFGHAFKKEHFPASNNSFVPVNHGSYGLPPQCVMDKYVEALYNDISSPDTFMRTKQPQEYVEALQALSSILNCSYKNLALVTNATSGVNTVLRSLPFEKGDKVAFPSTTYGACAKTIQFLADSVGIIPIVVPLDYPMSDAEVVATFEATFREHKIKLALFDTVISMPGVKVPYQQLSQLCKKYGVLSMVDGAHSIGIIPVSIDSPEFQPDFYVSNLHKWFSLPRGWAVMYVAPQHHKAIQTMPISHSYVSPEAELTETETENLLLSKFTYVSSNIYAAVSCIPTAIKFRTEVCGGEEAIREYCEDLARRTGEMTLRQWPGTQLLENEEKTLISAMVTLVVPIEKFSTTFDATNKAQVKKLIDFSTAHLVENHRTFVPIAAHNDKVVIRFSAQIYNELSDFEYAVTAVQETLKAFFAKESHL